MRQARPIEVVFAREEDLRFGLQAPEGERVDDPIAVLLERRAVVVPRLIPPFEIELVVEFVAPVSFIIHTRNILIP